MKSGSNHYQFEFWNVNRNTTVLLSIDRYWGCTIKTHWIQIKALHILARKLMWHTLSNEYDSLDSIAISNFAHSSNVHGFVVMMCNYDSMESYIHSSIHPSIHPFKLQLDSSFIVFRKWIYWNYPMLFIWYNWMICVISTFADLPYRKLKTTFQHQALSWNNSNRV